MCDEAECQQLTAEVKVLEIVAGKTVVRWRAKGRNEGTDCFAYALAALRISQVRWGLKLPTLAANANEQENTAPAKKRTLAELGQQLNG
jgi:phage terminase large subunit GpA-like protein